MFDVHKTDRIKVWRDFRDSLETAENPLRDVAEFWSKAPFVSKYLDPYHPEVWPDPWHLVVENRYDNLAIALGMCYTLQLTERFKASGFEIHMSISPKDNSYVLLVDNCSLLNLEPRAVKDVSEIPYNSIKIWSGGGPL